MKRKNKERKRRERFNRKARRPAEPEKAPKETNYSDSSTDSSSENEKDLEYDSDLSSEYDDGPAHGFYNKIANIKWKKELTANKIRLLREAKRYDRMMNHMMREVQRLSALVRVLMQRDDNMTRETRTQKAVKNEKKEHQKSKTVRTNINRGIQTEKIRKVDMAAQATEEESTSSSEVNYSILLKALGTEETETEIEAEESDASQNSMSSSEENNRIFYIITENEENDDYIFMPNPGEEQIANDASDIEQDEERRIKTESKITQTDPVNPEKIKVIVILIVLIRHVITSLRWPGLPQLPYHPISVIMVLVIIMMTALYFC